MTLDELALKYDTDKGSQVHNYCGIYEEIFKDIKPRALLEIGIYEGASLRMWRDFFPNTRIYGIDLNPDHCFNEGNITSFEVDQSDPFYMNFIGSQICDINGKRPALDIVIDDGSHDVNHQEISFIALYDRLEKNGIYVIEDLNKEKIELLRERLKGYNPEIIIAKPTVETPFDDHGLLVIRKK
jgi:hypothetical protein